MSSHYTGHKPDGESKMHDLKCGVNTRMPLHERIAPIQQTSASLSRTRAQSAGVVREPIRSYFLQKRHHGETTYMSCSKDYVRTGGDVPARKKEPVADVNYKPPGFDATTTNHKASAGVASGFGQDFFSKARKAERVDDDARRNVYIAPTRAGASHFQRTVDIMRKRETDPSLEPPKEAYNAIPKRPQNGVAPQSAADKVRFTHISPLTCNQMDFRAPRAVTGSVPSIHGIEKRRVLSTLASSSDMFAGTAKARNDLAPGFMGHVPSHPTNASHIQGTKDILRNYSKCSLNVASPSKTNARLVEESSTATAGSPMRSSESAQTMQSYAERQVFENTTEQSMNKVVCGKRNAVRKFFSAGAGDADNTLADQFCTKFRPGGGTMKQGPSSSWGWISDQELRRKTVL